MASDLHFNANILRLNEIELLLYFSSSLWNVINLSLVHKIRNELVMLTS